jgi:hypothetical protein
MEAAVAQAQQSGADEEGAAGKAIEAAAAWLGEIRQALP